LGERRFAIAAAVLSLVTCVAVALFAGTPLPRVAAFIPSYESALIINDLITAALLFGQFNIIQSRALLVLASGYFFTALMTVCHALTFSGLFSESGLLGAGSQSTAWLHMFWHAGFPVVVASYALLKDSGPGQVQVAAPGAIGLSIVSVIMLVVLLTALATAGESSLPEIMRGHSYSPAMILVVTTVWSLGLATFFVLFTRRSRAILDLWLMVVLCAWLCDIALSAVLNQGRFDLGFYAGRIYGLLASSCVLIVLLPETVTLYARLARSMEAEGHQRELRLREMRSELIHESRLNELGQMVSALAHEVNQPITAIGNYIRASALLVRGSEAPRALEALTKAANEAARAGEIIRRLRDFVKKNDGEKRLEDLRAMIEETLGLALAGSEEPGANVELHLHSDTSTAFIDKVQIQEVLLNLIRNAIEAMASQPRQALIIATEPVGNDMVEFSVADIGPGLSAEVRGKLFQPLVTTKATGMGVGLSICRTIIEAHGGRLWAEDATVAGTIFKLTVPRPPVHIHSKAEDRPMVAAWRG
jgi:signal transduction histidine kinase